MKRPITLLILLLVSLNMYGQKVLTASGTNTYVIPANVTLEQAEFYAVEQAKLRVIADTFGTVVGSSSTLTITENGDKSSFDSFTFGQTEVKGEWLETIGFPVIVREVINNEFVLNVTISGKIREIVSASIDFQAKVLRNGVTDNCESDRFKERDRMYLSFVSPENGYVSIYMTDGKVVQCLFPYSGLDSEYMKVKADERYVFFSKKESGAIDPVRVKECPLGCSADNEPNRIYVIFSPNKYSKAIDHSGLDSNMPRTLSYYDFHNWLSKHKSIDNEMVCKPFDIIISK